MKKMLFLFAALLPCFLAHSQEAEGTGSYAEFQVIPRLDGNFFFIPGQTGDGSSGFSLGNTSIYTLLEGAFSEHVSYTLSNHWFAASGFYLDDAAALYQSTLYSNTNNWLDVARFDFTFGNWTFTLGKDALATGGFEYDEWDVDVDYILDPNANPLLASRLWYNLPCYQWGGKVAYSIADHTTLALQAATSPFGERPFASGLYAFSFKWDGSYGPFSNMWSISAIQAADGKFQWLAALSNKLELGDWTIGLDWYNTADLSYDSETEDVAGLFGGHTFRPSLAWAPSDELDLKLQGNVYLLPLGGTAFNAGPVLHWRPLEWLQVNAALAWDNPTRSINAMAGVKINWTVFSL